MTAAQRQAATQQHALAIAAINEMFDKVDELTIAPRVDDDLLPLKAHGTAIGHLLASTCHLPPGRPT